MLTTVLIVGALVVFYVAHTRFHRGLRAKDLAEKSVQVAVTGAQATATVEPVTEVATVKEARSAVAKSRARNQGRFVADDPATPENEAFKGGRRPRVRVKK